MNGSAYSIPQYDTSNRGLMSTISAIDGRTPLAPVVVDVYCVIKMSHKAC
jgi:hypothetical protein